jgi:pyruvate-formate lyase-activating enzyme
VQQAGMHTSSVMPAAPVSHLERGQKYCPGKLRLDKLTSLDDLTWSSARNIISFTGADLACQPEFYVEATKEIKGLNRDLWVPFETNGYCLAPKNLVHCNLTGTSNKRVLELPAEIVERDFLLEVSSVYIPSWVGTDETRKIAELLAQVNSGIPYAIARAR